MKTRIITGALLVIVLLLAVFVLPKLVAVLLIGVFAAMAAYELLYPTQLVRHIRLLVYTMVAAFWMPLWCWFGAPHAWGLLLLLAFVIALFSEMMASGGRLHLSKVTICLFAGLVLPYLFSSLVRIFAEDQGRFLLMIPCILSFIPDSGAYFVGSFWGRHKLAPVLSPKKTVEGAIGGVVTGVLAVVLYALILDLGFQLQVNYLYAVIYGLVASLADIFGDLMFSAIKRQTGIKDYGNLFPGHGGILDRFDSIMIVAPLTEALLILIPMVV